MTRTPARLAAVLALAATLTIAQGLPAAAQRAGGPCLSNVEVQAALARGDVRSLPEVLSENGYRMGEWQVLGAARLCRHPEGLFYHLSVQSRSGQARTLVLQASG